MLSSRLHTAEAAWYWRQSIRIVSDTRRPVFEGELIPDEAEPLKAAASRDTGPLAINTLMSFAAVAALGKAIPRFAE